MKKNILFLFIVSICLLCCCEQNTIIVHKGENKAGQENVLLEWDSIVIDAFDTSGQGRYFMLDSVISYADYQYARIYNYNCHTGKLISQHFGRGQGPNESTGFFFATPVENDSSVFLLDNNIRASFYDFKNYNLTKAKNLDFGWSGQYTGNYELPSSYTFMSMTDLGGNVYNHEEKLLIPVNAVIKYTCENEIVTLDYFKKSHIFGLVDKQSMEFKKVFGNYPPSYHKGLMPHLGFFSHVLYEDTLYVSFPVDSLIYVYKYPDQLLYAFGNECNGINRNYTTSNTYTMELFDDLRTKGVNTEIMYFPETGIFTRTYYRNGIFTDSYGLQIYNKNHDLIADISVPQYFKLLGYYQSTFYGITSFPEETDENTFFTFYKFKILS